MYKFIVVLCAIQVANVFALPYDGKYTTPSNIVETIVGKSGQPNYGYVPVQPQDKKYTETVHLTPEQEMIQARNAIFNFGFLINDGISHNYQARSETRSNGVVHGRYSYDDGFVFRTVEYEADFNGFRITKEESSESRARSPDGVARVMVAGDGGALDYNITRDELNGYRRRADLLPIA